MRVLTTFDLQSNLGLTRGILDISVKKGTLVASALERVRHIVLDVLMAPWRKKNDIFGVLGSNTQIEDRQNMVSS